MHRTVLLRAIYRRCTTQDLPLQVMRADAWPLLWGNRNGIGDKVSKFRACQDICTMVTSAHFWRCCKPVLWSTVLQWWVPVLAMLLYFFSLCNIALWGWCRTRLRGTFSAWRGWQSLRIGHHTVQGLMAWLPLMWRDGMIACPYHLSSCPVM